MNNIEIRRPRFGDIEALNDFFTMMLEDTFAKEGLADLVDDIKKEIEAKKHHLHEDLNSMGKSRYFLLALDGGRIVGTIEYGQANEVIADCSGGKLKETVEIGTVFVHPDYQRQGIGTLMLNVMYLTLMNRNIEEFCLDSGYKRAQKVWKKKFGEPDYLLKDYWSEGFDHMVWRRSLKDVSIVFRG